MPLFVRQIACLTKWGFVRVIMLGVSYSHKSPAEGSIVAPPQVSSFFLLLFLFKGILKSAGEEKASQ